MLENALISLSQWFRPHLFTIALMIVATLLVLYGNTINGMIKRQIAGCHFILRTIIFILVCAFGYGLLTVWMTPFLGQLLGRLPNLYLGLVILIISIVLGVLAERKGQM